MSKKAEANMAAYDLTHGFRDAAELTGSSHHTTARYGRSVDAGQLQTTPVQRNQLIDRFAHYIGGWFDDSHGRVRADVVQDKLGGAGLGLCGLRARDSAVCGSGALLPLIAERVGMTGGCRS